MRTAAGLIATLVVLCSACNRGETGAGGPSAGASADKNAACGYKGKGFCLSPPAGFTAKEYTEPVPGTAFLKPDEPKPGQDLFVSVEDFELDPAGLQVQKKNFTGNGAKVIEDSELEGGKGFFLITEHPNNIMAHAMIAGGGKTVSCMFNAYLKDKQALEPWIKACKSLRLAD